MKLNKIIISYIIGFISAISLTVIAGLIYTASDIEFTPKDAGWNVDTVEGAINDIQENYAPKKDFGEASWEYAYTGTKGEFKAPVTGLYKIELWGAQGGTSASYIGGYGAYAVGERNLTKGDIFEFAVGGKGQDGYAGSGLLNGGYNGGGATKLGNDTGYGQKNSPGGGATHIAFKIDNEKELLVDYINNKDQIIIVAGGGGGAHYCKDGISEGGHGGGVIGTSPKSIFQVSASNCAHYIPVGGGTQTEGGVLGTSGIVASSGSFGKGGNYTTGNWGAGGGAGWYGGSSGNYGPGCVYGGAGGSSYINANELNNAEMYCYNCMESTIASENTISTTGNREEADKVNCPNGYSSDPISKCAKSGNGHLRITLIG